MNIFWFIQTQNIIAILVALATGATMLTLGNVILEKNALASRMRVVTAERNKIKKNEREKLRLANSISANESKSSKIDAIVGKIDVDKIFDIDSIKIMLLNAGLRGKKYFTLYIFSSLFIPPVLFVLGYVFFELAGIGGDSFGRLVFAMFLGLLSYFIPKWIVGHIIKKRQLSIRRAWPDALDLILICVESGMSMEVAMDRVAREIGVQSVELAEELTLTLAELSYLQDRRLALDNLSTRTGLDIVKAVTTSLIQAEKYGTPLSTALRVLSQESRDIRMSTAEKKAASLPPKLSVPLIVFFLPVLFMVIMGPAIIQVMDMK